MAMLTETAISNLRDRAASNRFINRVKHTCNIILGEFKLSVASIQFSLDDRSQQIRINATGCGMRDISIILKSHMTAVVFVGNDPLTITQFKNKCRRNSDMENK